MPRRDVPVELTSRETSCSRSCSTTPARLTPRRRCWTRCAGDKFEGDPNIVEVYISHLRRKLDEPFGRSSIETVRGAGYRLRVEEPA